MKKTTKEATTGRKEESDGEGSINLTPQSSPQKKILPSTAQNEEEIEIHTQTVEMEVSEESIEEEILHLPKESKEWDLGCASCILFFPLLRHPPKKINTMINKSDRYTKLILYRIQYYP